MFSNLFLLNSVCTVLITTPKKHFLQWFTINLIKDERFSKNISAIFIFLENLHIFANGISFSYKNLFI